jgi:putative ABC transport system permease protein
MEEHIWDLVELYLAGKLDESGVKELQSLLSIYPQVFVLVKEFLLTYKDPEPQVSRHEIERFLSYTSKQIKQYHQKVPQPYKVNNAFQLMRKGINREVEMAGQIFKIAFRNLRRNKSISAINISGLAVGIAGAMLILLWVQNQLSYDQFHANKERIYQVYNRTIANGEQQAWYSTPIPLAPAIKANFNQVDEAVRINWVGSFVLKNGEQKLESQGFITDPGFFKLFSFPLLQGNVHTALLQPHSIVITRKLAKKLFGDAEPVGKTIAIDSTANFTVTGLLKDLPANTSFNFEYLVPFDYMKEVHWYNDNWKYNSIQTYVMLKPGVSEATANHLFKNMYRRYGGEPSNDVIVHPMTKWWLYSKYENGKFVAGRLVVVHLFGIVALLIILVACINYMNLGTARSTRRAKEVGIRKVAGAGRGWLIKQFLGESLIVTFLSAVVGLVLVQLALPWFNGLVRKELMLPFNQPVFWMSGAGMVLLIGIIAGSYPAFYLSGFRPGQVLKGKVILLTGLVTPRKLLVVVQFTFAITFIISTVVIYRQINFAQKRDTGYNPDNLVFMYMKGDMAANYNAIKNELTGSGAVSSVTRTSSPVLDNWTDNDNYEWDGKPANARLSFLQNSTDHNFTATFSLPLIAGRDIDVYRYPSDTSSILLTQKAAKRMGFKNPVGRIVMQDGVPLHIVGVVKDYVAGSPYMEPLPIIIRGAVKQFGTVTLKLNTDYAIADNISKITSVFKKYNPAYPFDFKFMDESYRDTFKGEQDTGQLIAVFAGLSIFISCLGLFALAACMAEARVKEIGIRKVLGASVARIIALLSKDFLVLVLIAFGIASPIAWWLMSKWLQEYAYHTDLNWWIFGLTGLLSVTIGFLTVGSQAIKAAFANPAKSLKTE